VRSGPRSWDRLPRPARGGPSGLYHPGDTAIHHAPVAAKLGALVTLAVLTVVLRGAWTAGMLLGLTVLAAGAGRVPLRATAAGLRPVLVVVLILGIIQWWQHGWPTAVEVTGDLVALVLAGTVLTATTRVDDLLDALARAARPLRRIGLAPELLALAVALMLRTIPALQSLMGEVRDAARARGLERHPRALLVPAAIRTVARARAMGDALAARGLGE
jgi:biotin transport system permease protein